MGGLQPIETGIVHLGYFSWIGAFCPFSPMWVLSDECKSALKNPSKINENLRLFEIVNGDNDHMSGPTNARQTVRPGAQVYAALGGFHLFAAKADTLSWTANKLKEFGVAQTMGAQLGPGYQCASIYLSNENPNSVIASES